MANVWMFVLSATALLCLGSTVNAQGRTRSRDSVPRIWSVFDYPDPRSLRTDQQTLCGRFNVSGVCDPNSIITRTDADAIDNLIDEVYRDTTCDCQPCRQGNFGYMIRVAIMNQFERLIPNGENNTRGLLADAQMFAYILSERWRFHGACNETVLILYSRSDNILYTQTRRLTKLRLSNNDIKQISMNVRHYFDDTNTIADGLMEMIRRYKLILQGQHESALSPGAVVTFP